MMHKLVATVLIMFTAGMAKGQGLQPFVDSMMAASQIPELGYAVVSPSRVVEVATFGFHRIDDKSKETKAGLADYFHLGSNTKAITGFVAAYLVENKKIEWTTKVFDLFPEWKGKSDTTYAAITLADLLSHRARIRPYTSGLEYKLLPAFTGDVAEKRKQFAQLLLQQEPVTNNGKPFQYSNAGYSIAAVMLEQVAGKTWEQLVTELLDRKLKMKLAFGWPNNIATVQPYGHWMVNNRLTPLPPNHEYKLALAEPAGDISMPLPDYARFVQLHLQGLTGKDNVLKASTYQYLHYGLPAYAIGWGNIKNDSVQMSEHAGSAGTFFCYTLIDAIKKQAFIVVTNAATPQTQQAVFKLLGRLRKQYP